MDWKEIPWTKIRKFVAYDFKVGLNHLGDGLKMIMDGDDGYILEPSSKKRGAGSQSYSS